MSSTQRNPFSWTRVPRPDSVGSRSGPSVDQSVAATGKRHRDGVDDEEAPQSQKQQQPQQQPQQQEEQQPTRKRIRLDGPDLVLAFGMPFPCAFWKRPGGCKFRASCSYHHGVAQHCNCHEVACSKGHPERRAPRACDHGGPRDCRWNTLGECSFHHGDPTPCDCDSLTCPRAHLHRVVRQTKLRQEHPKVKTSDNSKRLYVGIPDAAHEITEDALRKVLSNAIRTATRSKTHENDDGNDPFITHITKIQRNVRCDRYAFIQLATPQLATACLQLNGLVLPQHGCLRIERPRDYTPPKNNDDNDMTVAEMIDFDVGQLNVLLPTSQQGKKKGKGRRGKGTRPNAKTT